MTGLRVYIQEPIPYSKKIIHSVLRLLSIELKFKVLSLDITFISGDDMLEVNKNHLKHDYKTDIITFAYDDSVENLSGEILISPEIAAENAARFGVSKSEELIRLVIHGVLHLLHYDDTTQREKKIMFTLQEALVIKAFTILKLEKI